MLFCPCLVFSVRGSKTKKISNPFLLSLRSPPVPSPPSTANYSIPDVTVACDNGICLVTCSSDNGYPPRDVEWSLNPPLNQSHWRVVNSSGWGRDPVSMLFSVVRSISVNCSSGLRLNLSCAVGGALSQEHTVCEY